MLQNTDQNVLQPAPSAPSFVSVSRHRQHLRRLMVFPYYFIYKQNAPNGAQKNLKSEIENLKSEITPQPPQK